MGDTKCYYLLSADAKFMEDRLKLNNLDLTSIVNALENKEDPAKIFHNADRADLAQPSVDYFIEGIESIKLWLDQNLLPTMHVMEKRDLRICVRKLAVLQTTIFDIMFAMKGSKKKDPKRKWNDSTKCYSCVCKECKETIALSNCNCDAIDLLEKHEHIGAVMSGNVLYTKQTDPIFKGIVIDPTKVVEISTKQIIKEEDITKTQTAEEQIITTETKEEEEELTAREIKAVEISPSTSSSSISESDESSNKSSSTKVQSSSSESNISPNLCLTTAEINKVIYPSKLVDDMKSTQPNFNYCTLQFCSENMHRCLLCDAILQEQSIQQHLLGQRHQFSLRDPYALKKVKNYHEIIARLPDRYQVHQVVLTPDKIIPFVQCKVCSDRVKETLIWTHLCSRKHKCRLYSGRYTKYNFFHEMLDTITTPEDDEDLSESSVKSLFIYNSNQAAQTVDTSKLNLISVRANDNNNTAVLERNDTTKLNNSSSIALISALTKTSSPASNNGHFLPNNTPETLKKLANDSIKLKQNENQLKKPVENHGPSTSKSVSKKPEKLKEVLKHAIIPSFKAVPQDLLDLLEYRFQPQRKFLQQVEDKIVCTACSVDIVATAAEIRKHVTGQNHEKLTKNKSDLKYRFYCDLCFKICHKEHTWAEHFTCAEHKQRCDTVAKTVPKISSFMEYECTTCRLVLYGNQNSVKYHQKETISRKLKIKVKEVKLPPQLDNLMKNNAIFYEKVHKLLKESEDVLNSIQLSWKCCEAIQNALKPVFGDCKAYPFGSRVSGLGNLGSDLDVFVDLGCMFDGLFFQDGKSQSTFVTETTKVLRRHCDFIDIVAIPQARTPIVQVYHRGTHLDCDLSFRHGLSVKNTEFLRLSIDVQPKLKSLILFLKHWSQSCRMNVRISTYALSMLSIFFMQTKGYLPSLTKIREFDPTEAKIIGGWRTYSCNKPIEDLQKHVTKCDLLIKDIVREFFLYYSEFKYNIEVVCPLLGQTVLKTDFSQDNGIRLPPEMRDYVEKINVSEDHERFRSLAPMCVQDPFDLSHNLTKAVPIEAVNKFVSLCKLSFTSLHKN